MRKCLLKGSIWDQQKRKYGKIMNDKRKYKRYIFPNDEKMTVDFRTPGTNGTIQARLLNISEGGLGFAISKEDASGIEIGTDLLIEGIDGINQFEDFKEITGKVRWILDHKPLENLGIGCEFLNLHEEVQKEIGKLVNG